MNTLQQIIEEMKVDLSKAKQGVIESKTLSLSAQAMHYGLALEKYIPKLESLLNEQPEAITDDSHFRKHDVGRSAADDEIPNKESSGESSSETQAVGQNEQTKEVCPLCNGTGKNIRSIDVGKYYEES